MQEGPWSVAGNLVFSKDFLRKAEDGARGRPQAFPDSLKYPADLNFSESAKETGSALMIQLTSCLFAWV